MNQYENNENEGYQGKYEYQGYGEYGQEMGEAENEQFVEIETKKGKKEKNGKRKKKKEIEPQYYMSVSNMTTINYKVYYMSLEEKLSYFIFAFIVGGFTGWLFFGGLFKNEFSQPTTGTYIADVIVIVLFGFFFGKMYLPMRTVQLKEKRKNKLKIQFRDMLEALTTSLNAGSNVNDSFQNVHEDMKVQYGEDSYIAYELSVILSGITNNFSLEEMLKDFGYRSGIDDILSFAQVFEICYRKGGNIKDVVRNTHNILSDKMRISEDIETQITAAKNENNIMIIMPIILIAMIKSMSPDFAKNFTTLTGIISTIISLVLFVIAYIVGRKLMEIKI